MPAKTPTVETKLSLNAVIAVQGIEFNVIIEAPNAQAAHAELAGLLGGPSAEAAQPAPAKQKPAPAATTTSAPATVAPQAEVAQPNPTQAAQPAPEPAQAAPAPTPTAQPAPEQAATATAPTATVTPSATATAGASGPTTGAAEISQTALIDKAKELLATNGGEATLGEILKAHGFGRVSTVPAESRSAVFADLADAVQGL